MASDVKNSAVAVVGLGYVGLPLAVAFAKAGKRVVGFDISRERIQELQKGVDRTGEVSAGDLKQASLAYSADPESLREADFIIVAVPTPVYENKKPDLRPLESASEIVGKNLKSGAIVIYESTVWPGLTEDYCTPIIEKFSRKTRGKDFFVGYSPERINPGDTEHQLSTIVKVVAGMDAPTLEHIAALYSAVCKAGVHKAPNIKIAEAAKVIENTQRDLNIALMNELAMIFKKIGISTRDVLEAAGTKWNFGRYTPGMVGGHCIPVDPYYLTALAERAGYTPKVILAGREINDSMPAYVAELLEEGLRERSKIKDQASKIKVLVLGLTFKENVPDTRNSPTKDLVKILQKNGYEVFVYDPYVSKEDTEKQFGAARINWPAKETFNGVIVTVAHREFVSLNKTVIQNLLQPPGVLVDVRGIFTKSRPQGIIYRSLL